MAIESVSAAVLRHAVLESLINLRQRGSKVNTATVLYIHPVIAFSHIELCNGDFNQLHWVQPHHPV